MHWQNVRIAIMKTHVKLSEHRNAGALRNAASSVSPVMRGMFVPGYVADVMKWRLFWQT
jgi:hypothetical protein